MKKLFDVYVYINKEISVKGKTCDICMLTFSGKVTGEYFNGIIVDTGVDTQTLYHDGKNFLSARYMLEGTDFKGKKCRIFIENNGNQNDGFTPKIVTDSRALEVYETMPLKAYINGDENGVVISVWTTD